MFDASTFIHPSAIVEAGAVIGAGSYIGAFCYIGSQVEIGTSTILKSHVVVNGITKIGRDNQIYQFATIGEVNQDLKYASEPTRVEVGDRNRIRESATIHRGTAKGVGLTKVGDDNLLMVNVHIGHDCVIGSNCILANNVALGGHVEIDDYAIIGGMSAIHQFCIIGAHVMVGGCSGIVQDVPPFIIAQGNHATPIGVNTLGLKRRGFNKNERQTIRNAYKILYRRENTLAQAKAEIATLTKDQPILQQLLDFFTRSTRGIIR